MNFIIQFIRQVFKLLEAKPSPLPCLGQYANQGEVTSLISTVLREVRFLYPLQVPLHFRVQNINMESYTMVETCQKKQWGVKWDHQFELLNLALGGASQLDLKGFIRDITTLSFQKSWCMEGVEEAATAGGEEVKAASSSPHIFQQAWFLTLQLKVAVNRSPLHSFSSDYNEQSEWLKCCLAF